MRMLKKSGRRLAAGLATLGWAGLILQAYLSISQGITDGGTVLTGLFRLAGFFTIITNLWAAFFLTVVAGEFRPAGRAPTDSAWAATTLYLSAVGIIYLLVLSPLETHVGWHVVSNAILHYAMPLGVFLLWVLYAPKRGLNYRQPRSWMIYPLVYCAYALLRGSIQSKYAYPFIDLDKLGWLRVTANSLGLAAGFYALGVLFVYGSRGSKVR